MIAALLGGEYMMRPSGAFLQARPEYVAPGSETFHQRAVLATAWLRVHEISRLIEGADLEWGRPLLGVLGSSVVASGVTAATMEAGFARALPDFNVSVRLLAMPGAMVTDDYVAASQLLRRIRPELTVYGWSFRDFVEVPQLNPYTTPLQTVWRDLHVSEAPRRDGGEDLPGDVMKTLSRIYRYRVPLRRLLTAKGVSLLNGMLGREPLIDGFAYGMKARGLQSMSNERRQAAVTGDPERFLRWIGKHRPTYAASIKSTATLESLTDDSVQFGYLRKLMSMYSEAGARLVLVAFPLNPLLTGAEKDYINRPLREQLFQRVHALSVEYGHGFIDCRDCLEAVYFVDLIHFTPQGQQVFGKKLGRLIAQRYGDSLRGTGLAAVSN